MPSPDIEAPEPSQEERENIAAQTELLERQTATIEEQARLNELLSPFIFESVGVIPQIGKGGQITGFRRDPEVIAREQFLEPLLFEEAGIRPITNEGGEIISFERFTTPEQERQDEIQRLFEERTLSALRGELPPDPALLADLEERKAELENELVRDFGSLDAARKSTPGQARLERFEEFEQSVLEGARRGDLSQAEQLGLTRFGATEDVGRQNFQEILQLTRGGGAGRPFSTTPITADAIFGPTAQGFGQAAAGFSNPIRALQNQRALQLEASMANAEIGNPFAQIAGQLAGTAGTFALGKAFGIKGFGTP